MPTENRQPSVAQISLWLSQRLLAGDVRPIARTRCDSVWVMDHFFQLPPLGGPGQPAYEIPGLIAGHIEAGGSDGVQHF